MPLEVTWSNFLLKQDCLELSVQVHVLLCLEYHQGDFTTSLGNLSPEISTPLTVKKCFLIFKWGVSYVNLCTLLVVLFLSSGEGSKFPWSFGILVLCIMQLRTLCFKGAVLAHVHLLIHQGSQVLLLEFLHISCALLVHQPCTAPYLSAGQRAALQLRDPDPGRNWGCSALQDVLDN